MCRSNPFVAKAPASPRKAAECDGLNALREGMGNMDITARANSGDISFSRERDRDSRETAKGRDVCISCTELAFRWADSHIAEQLARQVRAF